MTEYDDRYHVFSTCCQVFRGNQFISTELCFCRHRTCLFLLETFSSLIKPLTTLFMFWNSPSTTLFDLVDVRRMWLWHLTQRTCLLVVDGIYTDSSLQSAFIMYLTCSVFSIFSHRWVCDDRLKQLMLQYAFTSCPTILGLRQSDLVAELGFDHVPLRVSFFYFYCNRIN